MFIVQYDALVVTDFSVDKECTDPKKAIEIAACLDNDDGQDAVLVLALKPECRDAIRCPYCGGPMKIKAAYEVRKSGFFSTHTRIITVRLYCSDAECQKRYPSSDGFTRSHVILPDLMPSKSWYTAPVIYQAVEASIQTDLSQVDSTAYDFEIDHEMTVVRWKRKLEDHNSGFFYCLCSISGEVQRMAVSTHPEGPAKSEEPVPKESASDPHKEPPDAVPESSTEPGRAPTAGVVVVVMFLAALADALKRTVITAILTLKPLKDDVRISHKALSNKGSHGLFFPHAPP